MQILTQMGQDALLYARQGWKIFPCHNPVEGGCSCGRDCGSVGKHPRTPSGLHDASTDPAQITEWWTKWPDANIAVATGDGLYVLDVDGEVGEESLTCLELEHGALPETSASRTGRGRHLFFKCEEELANSAGKLGAFLDTRGDGGYVLLPPSLHETGNLYAWLEVREPAPAPLWLIEKVRKPVRSIEFILRDHTIKWDTQYTVHAYYRKWFQAQCDVLASTLEGGRNNRLYKLACWCGTCVQGGFGEPSWLENEVKQAAARCGLRDSAIERSWQSGYDTGWELNPLPDPPLKDDEGNRVVYAPERPEARPEGLIITPLSKIKKEKIGFLWGNRLVQEGVNLLVGDGGLGKSALALSIAYSITNGVPLPDDEGQRVRGDVMLVSYEDPASVIQTRAEVTGIDLDRLFIIEGKADPEDGYVTDFDKHDVASLHAALDTWPNMQMLIIDPWSKFLDGEDNQEHLIRRALAPLERMAQQRRITVLLIAHVNKNSDYSSAEYRIAGHSGFKNAARSALMIGKMTDTEMAITHVKHNWSPPAASLTYTWDASKKWDDGECPLTWGSKINLTGDELFAARDTSKQERVTRWLRRLIMTCGPTRADDAKEQGKDEGFTLNMIMKACDILGIVMEREPNTPHTVWRLPRL